MAASFTPFMHWPDLDLEKICCCGEVLHRPICLQHADLIVTGTATSQLSLNLGLDVGEAFIGICLVRLVELSVIEKEKPHFN